MKSDGKINTFALNGKTKIEKLRFYFLIFYCPARWENGSVLCENWR